MNKRILSMAIVGCLLINTAILSSSFSKRKVKHINNRPTILFTSSSIDPSGN